MMAKVGGFILHYFVTDEGIVMELCTLLHIT